MKTVLFKTQQIKKLSPVAADLGATSGPFKGMRPERGLYFGQHGQKAVRNGDGVRTAGSALGRGKRYGAGLQINAVKGDASFFEPTSSVQRNFKTDAHPFRNVWNGQRPAYLGNVLIGENGLTLNGGFAGAKINHGHGSHVAKQPALPVNPFQNLNVLQGLVAADKGSIGSGGADTPGNVIKGRGRGKILQNNSALGHKPAQVSPAVSVIYFGIGSNLMVVQKAGYPSGVRCSLVALSDRKSGRLLNRFCPVQGVVGSVTGGSGFPHSVSRFVSYVIPLAVGALVNTGHGTSKSNHLKIGNN